MARGSSRQWRKVRRLTFASQGRRCALALPGVCTEWATQVHHTEGYARTGDDPRHVVPSCQPCNRKVGDPAAARRADPRPRPVTRW